VDVRFIEFMPMGGGTRWRREHYWPAAEILASASALADLTPVAPAGVTSGPARMYAINGSQGRLGIISPLSNHFCDSCNRLRITSDGRLRTCLFSDREYRLRPVLRRLGPEAALRVMRAACALKPLGHDLLERRTALAAAGRHMSAIGG
jgi:cyclic pyranopterin phosphate synthase